MGSMSCQCCLSNGFGISPDILKIHNPLTIFLHINLCIKLHCLVQSKNQDKGYPHFSVYTWIYFWTVFPSMERFATTHFLSFFHVCRWMCTWWDMSGTFSFRLFCLLVSLYFKMRKPECVYWPWRIHLAVDPEGNYVTAKPPNGTNVFGGCLSCNGILMREHMEKF